MTRKRFANGASAITSVLVLQATVAAFSACSGPSVAAGGRPKSYSEANGTSAEYVVVKQDASKPNRGGKPVDAVAPLEAPAEGRPDTPETATNQGCDAAECEGDLTANARQQVTQAIAGVRECYEAELKDNSTLEGRISLLIRLPGDKAKQPGPCVPKIESAAFKLSDGFSRCIVATLGKVQARGKDGCVDVAIPLNLVREEVEAPAKPNDPNAKSTPPAPVKKR